MTLENNDIFSVLLYNHFLLSVVFSFGIWLAISNPFTFNNAINIDIVNLTAGNMLIKKDAVIGIKATVEHIPIIEIEIQIKYFLLPFYVIDTVALLFVNE